MKTTLGLFYFLSLLSSPQAFASSLQLRGFVPYQDQYILEKTSESITLKHKKNHSKPSGRLLIRTQSLTGKLLTYQLEDKLQLSSRPNDIRIISFIQQ